MKTVILIEDPLAVVTVDFRQAITGADIAELVEEVVKAIGSTRSDDNRHRLVKLPRHHNGDLLGLGQTSYAAADNICVVPTLANGLFASYFSTTRKYHRVEVTDYLWEARPESRRNSLDIIDGVKEFARMLKAAYQAALAAGRYQVRVKPTQA